MAFPQYTCLGEAPLAVVSIARGRIPLHLVERRAHVLEDDAISGVQKVTQKAVFVNHEFGLNRQTGNGGRLRLQNPVFNVPRPAPRLGGSFSVVGQSLIDRAGLLPLLEPSWDGIGLEGFGNAGDGRGACDCGKAGCGLEKSASC